MWQVLLLSFFLTYVAAIANMRRWIRLKPATKTLFLKPYTVVLIVYREELLNRSAPAALSITCDLDSERAHFVVGVGAT